MIINNSSKGDMIGFVSELFNGPILKSKSLGKL